MHHARPALERGPERAAGERRIQRTRSGVASCVPTSKNHLAKAPKILSWSIVCPAPTSRSSGGRSAVSTISGTRASCASTTAGSSSATAVPDVHVMATGRPEAFASPTAKNPAQRSSTCEWQRSRSSRASVSTSGVQREPGEVHASRIPQRASSSTNAPSSL